MHLQYGVHQNIPEHQMLTFVFLFDISRPNLYILSGFICMIAFSNG
uniref:Uncharacterized protein n=1 Tax=Arundo donax TaxID=35708 RepID=A0A0A9A1N4_ARUDO